MSRMKTARRNHANDVPKKQDWPVVVYIWPLSLTIVSYLVARVALDGRPHPYHWAAALLGGLVGIPVGWLWYRWRGDIF